MKLLVIGLKDGFCNSVAAMPRPITRGMSALSASLDLNMAVTCWRIGGAA